MALALVALLGFGTWWYATRSEEPLPWVPTDAQCETYLGLDDAGQADWVERSIEASWPEVRDTLTVSELRTIIRRGFATCDD